MGGPKADDKNVESDWLDYIHRWGNGIHAENSFRENNSFRERMVKVAALAMAAIEAEDRRSGV